MNLGLRGRWVLSGGARGCPLTSARVGPAGRGPPRRRSLRVGFVNFTVKLVAQGLRNGLLVSFARDVCVLCVRERVCGVVRVRVVCVS